MRYDKPTTQTARKTIRFLASSTRSRMLTSCLNDSLWVLISNRTPNQALNLAILVSRIITPIGSNTENESNPVHYEDRGVGIGAAEKMRIASERVCDWEEGFAFNARTVRFRCSSLWLSLRVCVFCDCLSSAICHFLQALSLSLSL